MRPVSALLPYEEAKRMVDRTVKPLDRAETTRLEDSFDRVLAEDIYSDLDVPGFDRAAMDGYAIVAEDVEEAKPESPVELEILGVLDAGSEANIKVVRGKCVQISTGARMPDGANAVVMVEDTSRSANFVSIKKAVRTWGNVGRAGEDIKKGEMVLSTEEVLTPGKVGVLAALGLIKCNVFARPVVSVFATGDEVVPVGGRIAPGQVYDINTHTIACVLKENGCSVIVEGVLRDNREEMETALKAALTSDLIVLSGSSSAGSKDLLEDVLSSNGTVLFHGVKMKPGKPTMLATLQGKPIFVMPGYPTSCLMNSYLFLVPCVRRLARLPQKYDRALTVPLAGEVTSARERTLFLTVRIDDGRAVPVFKESGAITSISRADGFIEVPAERGTLNKGELVQVHLF